MSKSPLEESAYMPHSLHLQERKTLDVRGVTEIISFDNETIHLRTSEGDLIVSGKSLRVKSLLPDKSEAHVEGEIHSIAYSKGKSKASRRLSDIFR